MDSLTDEIESILYIAREVMGKLQFELDFHARTGST
jgi:hypothetical protein